MSSTLTLPEAEQDVGASALLSIDHTLFTLAIALVAQAKGAMATGEFESPQGLRALVASFCQDYAGLAQTHPATQLLLRLVNRLTELIRTFRENDSGYTETLSISGDGSDSQLDELARRAMEPKEWLLTVTTHATHWTWTVKIRP